MRHFRPAAIFANQKLNFFQSQMRAPAPDFTLAVMFYWYATHDVENLEFRI